MSGIDKILRFEVGTDEYIDKLNDITPQENVIIYLTIKTDPFYDKIDSKKSIKNTVKILSNKRFSKYSKLYIKIIFTVNSFVEISIHLNDFSKISKYMENYMLPKDNIENKLKNINSFEMEYYNLKDHFSNDFKIIGKFTESFYIQHIDLYGDIDIDQILMIIMKDLNPEFLKKLTMSIGVVHNHRKINKEHYDSFINSIKNFKNLRKLCLFNLYEGVNEKFNRIKLEEDLLKIISKLNVSEFLLFKGEMAISDINQILFDKNESIPLSLYYGQKKGFISILVENNKITLEEDYNLRSLENTKMFNINDYKGMKKFIEKNHFNIINEGDLTIDVNINGDDIFKNEIFNTLINTIKLVRDLKLDINYDLHDNMDYSILLKFIDNQIYLENLKIKLSKRLSNKSKNDKLIEFISTLKIKKLELNMNLSTDMELYKSNVKEEKEWEFERFSTLLPIFKNVYLESLIFSNTGVLFEDIMLKYLPYNKNLKYLNVGFCLFKTNMGDKFKVAFNKNYSIIDFRFEHNKLYLYNKDALQDYIKEFKKITERNKKLQSNKFLDLMHLADIIMFEDKNMNKRKKEEIDYYSDKSKKIEGRFNDEDDELIEKARRAKEDIMSYLLRFVNDLETIRDNNPEEFEKIINK